MCCKNNNVKNTLKDKCPPFYSVVNFFALMADVNNFPFFLHFQVFQANVLPLPHFLLIFEKTHFLKRNEFISIKLSPK